MCSVLVFCAVAAESISDCALTEAFEFRLGDRRMIYDRHGANSLRQKFLEQFAAGAGLSFLMMGFYDCLRQDFTESWLVRRKETLSEEGQGMPQDIRRALAVQASLQMAGSEAAATTYPLWLRAGAYMLGLGRPAADVFAVMAIPAETWTEEPGFQALLRIGMAYIRQQHIEAVYARSPWPDGLAAATLKMLALRFLVVDEKAEVQQDGRLEDEAVQDDLEWVVLNRRLTLNDRKERMRLHEAIEKATGEERRTSIITVSTFSRGVRLAVVGPLAGSDPPLAVVLFEHAGTDHAAMREHFFRAHGLTPSEQRIAHVILDGRTLNEAAETTSLSPATVRSYLKSVFNKTDTHRQSELIALYYRSILPVGTSIAKAAATPPVSQQARPATETHSSFRA